MNTKKKQYAEKNDDSNIRASHTIPWRTLLSHRTSTIRPFTAENRQSHYPIVLQIPERHCREPNSKFVNVAGHNVLYVVRVYVFFERRITRFAQVSKGPGRGAKLFANLESFPRETVPYYIYKTIKFSRSLGVLMRKVFCTACVSFAWLHMLCAMSVLLWRFDVDFQLMIFESQLSYLRNLIKYFSSIVIFKQHQSKKYYKIQKRFKFSQ